jgi:hypothetical protein
MVLLYKFMWNVLVCKHKVGVLIQGMRRIRTKEFIEWYLVLGIRALYMYYEEVSPACSPCTT